MPSKAMSARTSSLADPRHLMRFLRKEAGLTPREIALAEGVKEQTVKASIVMVESYRAQNSTVEFDFAVRNLVLSAVPGAKAALIGLLSATELIEVNDEKTGTKKVIRQEDKTTRLEALRIVSGFVGQLQPKQAPVEVNVSQTNQVANLSTAETTEERLRRLRAKQKEYNALPPEVAAVPDAIDSGDEDDDEEDGDDE